MPVALGVKGVFVSLPWQCVSSGQAIDADQAVSYEVGRDPGHPVVECAAGRGGVFGQPAADEQAAIEALNAEYGKTIVMVTHDPRAAERARRTLHLEKGVLVENVPA